MKRRCALWAAATSVLALLNACADQPPSYYAPPPPKALQPVPEGKAVVYLLRAPHDAASLALNITGVPTFELPAETYVVLTLQPGTYTLEGSQSSLLGKTTAAFAPTAFKVEAGQRAFLYTSSETSSGFPALDFFRGSGGILIAMAHGATSNRAVSGTRKWQECTELDAQGFMSIAKQIAAPAS